MGVSQLFFNGSALVCAKATFVLILLCIESISISKRIYLFLFLTSHRKKENITSSQSQRIMPKDMVTQKNKNHERQSNSICVRLALYIYLHVNTWKPIWASAFVAAAPGPAGDWDYSETARENHTSSDSFMLCSSLPDPLIFCMSVMVIPIVCLICRTSTPWSIHPLVDKTCFWSHSRDQSARLPLRVLSYPPFPSYLPGQQKLEIPGYSRKTLHFYIISTCVLGTS